MTSCGALWKLLMRKVFIASFLCTWASLHTYGQTDTTAAEPVLPRVEVETRTGTIEGKKVGKSDGINYDMPMRSPKKAAMYSAIFPGAGQFYNRKYWKIPILYAGFAVTGYYLNDNLQNMRFYKDQILAIIEDPTLDPTGQERDFATRNLEQFTQWRDLAYITFAIIYILNIVDASVDAHLAYFDVSEDIALQIKPFWTPLAPFSPGITLCLKL